MAIPRTQMADKFLAALEGCKKTGVNPRRVGHQILTTASAGRCVQKPVFVKKNDKAETAVKES